MLAAANWEKIHAVGEVILVNKSALAGNSRRCPFPWIYASKSWRWATDIPCDPSEIGQEGGAGKYDRVLQRTSSCEESPIYA